MLILGSCLERNYLTTVKSYFISQLRRYQGLAIKYRLALKLVQKTVKAREAHQLNHLRQSFLRIQIAANQTTYKSLHTK